MNRRTFARAILALLPATATTSLQAEPMPRAAGANKASKTQIVTRTFTNRRLITIPETGTATPYPSTITVRGLRNGRILDVNLKLHRFSHELIRDVDLLLVAPNGQAAIVMSDVAQGSEASSLALTLDGQAAAPLPEAAPLTSGSFRPANYTDPSGPDVFPAPAPQGVTNTALSIFRGAKANGRWRLFLVDDAGGDVGRISAGWSLTIKARIRTRK